MANPLNRNLVKGNKIVFQNGQVGICLGKCFGNFDFTLGTALDVEIDGQIQKTNSYDIDAKATLRMFAEENGWAK